MTLAATHLQNEADAPLEPRNPDTPICSIPVEVLASIFETSRLLYDEDLRDGREDYDDVPPEVVLSHVGPHFRRVTLLTPTLWCHLLVSSSSAVDMVETYLKRSSTCLLNIRAHLSVESDTERERLDALLDLVIPHSYRWLSLVAIQDFESAERPSLVRLCAAHAPLLKHLTLEVEDVDIPVQEVVDNDASLPQILTSGNSSPRFVRLRGVAMNYFRPRLSQVTTMHLEQVRRVPVQYHTFKTIVTTSSNLTNLSIDGDIIPAGQWPSQPGSLPLPNLLSLRICGVSGEVYAGLLLVMDAPRLRSLWLKNVQHSDLDRLWSNNASIESKFSSVKEISFVNFDLSPATFERFCDIFPEVTSFQTLHSPMDPCQFVYLILERSQERNGGTRILWPSLQHLSIPEGNDDRQITQIIDARRRDGRPLSTLTLVTKFEDDEEIPPAEFPELAEFPESGVKVQFLNENIFWPDSGTSFLDLDDQWISG